MTEPARYLRTVVLPLGRLQHFPGNAKRGDLPTLLDSLRRNGQYRSLIARHTDGEPLTVLAGNHTLAALALHGPGDCGRPVRTRTGPRPCGICSNHPAWQPTARAEVVDCDDDTARRINLVDNRSAERGTYDRDALAELLSYLDDDLTGTGYTDADVQRLIAPPPSLEELADTYAPREDYDDQPTGPPAGTPAPTSQDATPQSAAGGLWPVLRMRVPPSVRDAFYAATAACPRSADDGTRLAWLLEHTRTTPQ